MSRISLERNLNVGSHCFNISTVFYQAELDAVRNRTGNYATLDNAPFYDSETFEPLGFFTYQSTFMENDCTGAGTYSFGDTIYGPYPGQVATHFTCDGKFSSITGGSGWYGCATGNEVSVYANETIQYWDLVICGTLCPI